MLVPHHLPRNPVLCQADLAQVICHIPVASYLPQNHTKRPPIPSPTKRLRRLHLCATAKATILAKLWDLEADPGMISDIDSALMLHLRQLCGVHFEYDSIPAMATCRRRFHDALQNTLRQAVELGLAAVAEQGEYEWQPIAAVSDLYELAIEWTRVMATQRREGQMARRADSESMDSTSATTVILDSPRKPTRSAQELRRLMPAAPNNPIPS